MCLINQAISPRKIRPNAVLPTVLKDCIFFRISHSNFKILSNYSVIIVGAFFSALLGLLFFSFSPYVSASTFIVEESEFEQLQIQALHSIEHDQEPFEFLHLLAVDSQYSKTQKLLLQHLALNRIDVQRKLSSQELAFLKTLALERGELEIVNSEHPLNTIPAINISKQVQSLISINELNVKEADISEKWALLQFNWKNFLTPKLYPSLNLFVKKQNNIALIVDNFIGAYHVEDISESMPDNQLLLSLIEVSIVQKNIEHSLSSLFEMLLNRPVDQFSYQAIKLVNKINDSQFAISILKIAAKNQKLSSQSLLILAKHYSQSQEAKNILQQSLNNKDIRWHALMAVSQIDNQSVKLKLIDSIPLENQAFRQSAETVLRLNQGED